MNFETGTWWLVALIFTLALSVVGYFLKRTINKTDEHDRDINHIKQTYVSKAELQGFRQEIRGDMSALAADVREIKENTLTKADFYRTQTATERKIDKMYDLLMQMKNGGKTDG